MVPIVHQRSFWVHICYHFDRTTLDHLMIIGIMQRPEKVGLNEDRKMAVNKPYDDGKRIGAVRDRSQCQMPSGHWVKRDTETGQFMDVKADKTPFKGVRKEK